MMKSKSRLLLLVIIVTILLAPAGCGSSPSGTEGDIIEAKQAVELIGKSGIVLVDMRGTQDYRNEHIKGAVNIPRDDIVIDHPVPNMLAHQEKIEETLGKNGISNDTLVVVYDNTNNIDAARLWWTLKVYGHEKVKVVSGGWNALKAAGLATATGEGAVTAVKYSARAFNGGMIASLDEVKYQVESPQKNVVILDTRSREEFEEGRIPGAVLFDYLDNNFADGTYKPVQHIKIQYLEAGIKPDNTVIMYCKTSMRAAQTYLALYNAGYRNLKLYDGAWLEWTSIPQLPVEPAAGGKKTDPVKVEPSKKDMS